MLGIFCLLYFSLDELLSMPYMESAIVTMANQKIFSTDLLSFDDAGGLEGDLGGKGVKVKFTVLLALDLNECKKTKTQTQTQTK